MLKRLIFIASLTLGLTLFFSSCGGDEEEDPPSINIPLAFFSPMAEGDYTVKITITAADIANAILSEQNLAIVEGANRTYDVTIDNIPVGDKRGVKVEIFEAGKRLFEGVGTVNISSGENQLALRLEKVAEFLSSDPKAGAPMLGTGSVMLNFSAPPGGVTVNGTPASVQGTTAVWIAPGLAAGATTLNVTWTAAGGGSDTIELLIIGPPATIAVTPSSATLTALGATVQLSATVTDGKGQSVSGAGVTWQSSNPVVAGISAEGLVTAHKNGSATITAAAGGVSATIVITVSQVSAAIAVAPASATLTAIGETVQLRATVTDGKDQPVSGASVTWKSSNPTVAGISAEGLVTAHKNGSATITAAAGGVSATVVITVSQASAAIAVAPASATLAAIGETVQLRATVTDGKGQPVSGASVTWKSSNPAVADVGAEGLVTAHKNGSATITATAGGVSATVVITVSQTTTTVTVTPASATLTAIGETVQLRATVTDGRDQPVSGASVTWQSSTPAVAGISAEGLVSAHKNGSATITAAAGGVSVTVAITVSQMAATIAITPSSGTLTAIGETVQLRATVTDGKGQPVSDASMRWSSNNSAVASVSSSGLVTARGNGTTTITATAGSKSAGVTIKVAQSAMSLTLTPVSATLTALGETVQLRATVKDGNGQPISSASVRWSSNNSAVASVSSSGLVTARQSGRATITAASGGKSATAVITVSQTAATIAIAPSSATLTALGETVQLRATVTDGRGQPLSGASVRWSSGNSAVASVSSSGLVTARRNGGTTITAASGGVSAIAGITVSQTAATIAITPSSATLTALGETVQLRATVTDGRGQPVSGASVRWSSSNSAVASVSSSGLVTTRRNGGTTITATSGGKSATAGITVSQVIVAVAVTPSSVTLTAIGETVQLSATVKDGRGQPVSGASVIWISSAPAVAGVSSKGLVTARQNGSSTTITAASGGKSTTVVITVSQAAATIAVTPSDVTLPGLGETVQLSTTVKDGKNQPVSGASVRWSSSNSGVASVSSSGLVTARKDGSTIITAASGDVSAIAVITVWPPDLIVQLTTPSNSMVVGATFTLSARVQNQGHGQTKLTTLRYYRSTDSTINTSDTAVGTAPGPGLAASQISDNVSIRLTVPSSAGIYYYGACVEADSGEGNTGNNCSEGVAITVKPISTDGMVLIPAGEFQMGSDDSDAYDDEKPVHPVYVDAFYMDIYEVTNAQYKKFVEANSQWGKDRIPRNYHRGYYLRHWNGNSYPSGRGDHPVVAVSWYGAMAYSQWAGKRLPTEAEWEKAARGGLVGKKYPWGDSIDSNKANYDRNIGDTTPVGNYPPNGYGLYDMAGNVWEWCLDEYDGNFYARSPRDNPVAGGTITSITDNFTSVNVKPSRVLRGGSWGDVPVYLRAAFRDGNTPAYAYYLGFGFRCARAQ